MSNTHRAPTAGQQLTDSTDALITSAVLAVVMRVAGPVAVGVLPHGLGTPERQVSIRIGDAVVHLTDVKAAAVIRQRWDAGSAWRCACASASPRPGCTRALAPTRQR